MIVRKRAEGEGSRYQVTLEEHTPQILQQYTERSATEEQDRRGTPTTATPLFPPCLPNPLTPSPCRVTTMAPATWGLVIFVNHEAD